MIQRDLRDSRRGRKVHTVDRKGSCQTVSKRKEVRVRRTLTYIDYCRGSTLSTSERRIQEIEDGEKREKTAKLSALYTQLPPSILC